MKHVLITGCSRGLGLEMAREFAQREWRVSGCARDGGVLSALAKELGDPHFFSPLEVSAYEQVEFFAEQVTKEIGPPDLLLNNAAIINTNAPLWEVAVEEFSQVIDINIKGVFHLIRAFLPAMIERGEGAIVNFSSGWGRSTSPEVAPYCATKFAIEGMSQALAQELPRGMASVALNPGIINTDMLRSTFGEGGASGFVDAKSWAKTAVPFLMGINSKDSGKALTAP